MFGSHAGARGRWYAGHYAALVAKFGPFDPMVRQFAGSVAALWSEWRSDTVAVEEAERARRNGKGRRPSVQAVARLKKRAGLSWGSYDAALRRLEGMAADRPFDPATWFDRGERKGMDG